MSTRYLIVGQRRQRQMRHFVHQHPAVRNVRRDDRAADRNADGRATVAPGGAADTIAIRRNEQQSGVRHREAPVEIGNRTGAVRHPALDHCTLRVRQIARDGPPDDAARHVKRPSRHRIEGVVGHAGTGQRSGRPGGRRLRRCQHRSRQASQPEHLAQVSAGAFHADPFRWFRTGARWEKDPGAVDFLTCRRGQPAPAARSFCGAVRAWNARHSSAWHCVS